MERREKERFLVFTRVLLVRFQSENGVAGKKCDTNDLTLSLYYHLHCHRNI